MPNRHTDQERWEVFFLQLLLAYRPMIFFSALVVLVYAVAVTAFYPLVSAVTFGLAAILFLLVYSYQAALYAARFSAWLVIFWKRADR